MPGPVCPVRTRSTVCGCHAPPATVRAPCSRQNFAATGTPLCRGSALRRYEQRAGRPHRAHQPAARIPGSVSIKGNLAAIVNVASTNRRAAEVGGAVHHPATDLGGAQHTGSYASSPSVPVGWSARRGTRRRKVHAKTDLTPLVARPAALRVGRRQTGWTGGQVPRGCRLFRPCSVGTGS